MKCKRCGEPEDRIHGFCSIRCEELFELETEVQRLRDELSVWREDYALLQAELQGLRDELQDIAEEKWFDD